MLLAFIINRGLKRDGESRTDAKLRLHLELPVHTFHNCLADAETKSVTVFVFHLVEIVSCFEVGLEQVFKVLGRYTDSFVNNLDTNSDKAACSRCAFFCCNFHFDRVV